jgi:hypothetical protein
MKRNSESHVRLENPHDELPLGITVNLKVDKVMSVVDTGAYISCIRRDVLNTLVNKGLQDEHVRFHVRLLMDQNVKSKK